MQLEAKINVDNKKKVSGCAAVNFNLSMWVKAQSCTKSNVFWISVILISAYKTVFNKKYLWGHLIEVQRQTKINN